LFQEQWNHRGLSHKDGDDLAPRVRLPQLSQLPLARARSLRLEWRHQSGLIHPHPPFTGKSLAVYLKANPVLEALYTAKQDMALLLTQKSLNAKKASQLIPDLLRLIDQFASIPHSSLAHTLLRSLPTRRSSDLFSRNNGITEGFHTKM